MTEHTKEDKRPLLVPSLIIGAVVCVTTGAFAYTAGWLTPNRITPEKLVASLAPAGGPALGHRRNHAKGICFTGTFDANGQGVQLASTELMRQGHYRVIGRFNLATADPNAKDGMVRVRGLGIQIVNGAGQEWRSAMIDAPFFPVSNPKGFYDLQIASHSKDPNAMPSFVKAHPEFASFASWAKNASMTGSYAEERYNSLDSFVFTNASGERRVGRWSLIPVAIPNPITAEDLAKRGPDFLEHEISDRVTAQAQQWKLVITIANTGDPTSDPNKPWPADRQAFDVGIISAQQVEAEADGPCRDINYDPTVLPPGITTSDDPFPAARSAAYSKSFNSRTSESASYPRQAVGGSR